MRIFVTSDVHVDYRENKLWIDRISAFDHQDDLLIVAGDVSDNLNVCLETLKQLKSKFREIAFIPGNHDVWICKNDFTHSFLKLEALIEEATQLGVRTRAFDFYGVMILPVFSWYDFSFGIPSNTIKMQWRDFNRCIWPEMLDQNQITDHFFSYNDQPVGFYGEKIISFSHFVPRMDLFPHRPSGIIRELAPCLGSTRIEAWIRKLKPQVHIFGHSHLNRDEWKNGIRYINNAFGYPHESHICRKQLFEIRL